MTPAAAAVPRVAELRSLVVVLGDQLDLDAAALAAQDSRQILAAQRELEFCCVAIRSALALQQNQAA